MHLINAIGVERVIENTNRLRAILEREHTNPIHPEVDEIRKQLIERYNNSFINDLFMVLSKLNNFDIPSRDSLYDQLRHNPFVCIVQESDENGNGYPCGVPLLVMHSGPHGLMTADGSTGGHVCRNIRLASDEEIMALSMMVA